MYSEQDIEGKGIGCIANQKIKKGTLILREAPVLPFSAEDWTIQELSRLLKAYEETRDEDKEGFMKLSNSFSGDRECFSSKVEHHKNYIKHAQENFNSVAGGLLTEEEIDEQCKTILKCWQIFESNGFHNGVYLKMSRFNHCCSSNAEYFWNEDIDKRDIRARRNIKTGEEITVSYLSIDTLTRIERQEKLKEDFNFECKCEVCSKTDDEINIETAKIQEFRKIFEEKKDLKSQLHSRDKSLVTSTPMAAIRSIKAELEYVSKMYKIAKELKLLKNIEILTSIVEEGFDAGCQGVLLGRNMRQKYMKLNPIPEADLDDFMKAANNFANVGEHISVVTYGEDHSTSREWKQRRNNPIDFFLTETRCIQGRLNR